MRFIFILLIDNYLTKVKKYIYTIIDVCTFVSGQHLILGSINSKVIQDVISDS